MSILVLDYLPMVSGAAVTLFSCVSLYKCLGNVRTSAIVAFLWAVGFFVGVLSVSVSLAQVEVLQIYSAQVQTKAICDTDFECEQLGLDE